MAAENQIKNYNGIDLLKFICAILVFIIHIPPFQGEVFGIAKYINFGLQRYLCRIAVPFYFVSSGFFLFKKMSPYDLNTEAIKKYGFKILRLLGVWHVLLFIGGTGHLWYMGATVIAVAFLSICFYFRIRCRHICVLACLFYLVGLLGDSYYGMVAPLTEFTVFKYLFKGYELTFARTRNGIFMGVIFVLMGAAFAWHKNNLKPRTSLIGFVVSMLCLFVEAFLLEYNDIPIDYNMYVFLLPAVYFLFSFAYTVRLNDRAIYKHLRNIGMLIYFSHMLIYTFVLYAVLFIKKCCGFDATPFLFITSLIFTLLISIFAERLSRKDKFKWINWFLS